MLPKKKPKLSHRQSLLVDAYVKNGFKNAEQSALEAGYSKASARGNASHILAFPHVAAAVEARKNTIRKRWSKEDKLLKLEKIAETDSGLLAIKAIEVHNKMLGDNEPEKTQTELTGISTVLVIPQNGR